MSELILHEQEKGIKARLTELRKKRDVILKTEGIKEQMARLRTELAAAAGNIDVKKTILDGLKNERAEIVRKAISVLIQRMKQILPAEKEPVIEITEDGKINIGLKNEYHYTSYAGLSGGEKCEFDLALSLALTRPEKDKLLILEAAEADPERLNRLLNQIKILQDNTVQVIVNTWYKPDAVPEGWIIWKI